MTTTTVGKQESTVAEWLTVERLLFGVILLVGAGVRLFGLSDQPLSPLEAANAWPAWLRAMALDAPVDATPTSALLFSLQTFLFWLTGGGDGAARFVTAAAGIALIWLPWLWRSWLGRTAAMIVALLIAVDPWLVAFSRFAGGASLTLLLFAATLTCLIRLSGLTLDAHVRWRYWRFLASAGGLLLVSGPLIWSLAPILLAFVLIYGRPPLLSGDEDGSHQHGRASLVVLFLGSALLGSTAWLSYPGGIGQVGGSLVAWLRQFVAADVYSISWALTRLVVDQSLLLLMGGVGLFLLWRGHGPVVKRGRRQWAMLLSLWAGWGILLLLLPGRDPGSLLVLHGSLLLATAYTIGALVERVPPEMDWREAAIVLGVFAILLISLTFWGRAFVADVQLSLNMAAILLLLVISLALILAVYGVWASWHSALWLGGALLSVLLLASSLSSLWQLNHVHEIAAPDGLFAETAHPDVRQLADNVATISAQRVGDEGEMPIQVQMVATADPVLGWYLRDMRRLDWVLTPDPAVDNGQRPLVITAGPELAAAGDYSGSAYDVQARWLPSKLWQGPIDVAEPLEDSSFSQRLQDRLGVYWRQRAQPILRWMIYREAATPPATERVILWAPMETAGGE